MRNEGRIWNWCLKFFLIQFCCPKEVQWWSVGGFNQQDVFFFSDWFPDNKWDVTKGFLSLCRMISCGYSGCVERRNNGPALFLLTPPLTTPGGLLIFATLSCHMSYFTFSCGWGGWERWGVGGLRTFCRLFVWRVLSTLSNFCFTRCWCYASTLLSCNIISNTLLMLRLKLFFLNFHTFWMPFSNIGIYLFMFMQAEGKQS